MRGRSGPASSTDQKEPLYCFPEPAPRKDPAREIEGRLGHQELRLGEIAGTKRFVSATMCGLGATRDRSCAEGEGGNRAHL